MKPRFFVGGLVLAAALALTGCGTGAAASEYEAAVAEYKSLLPAAIERAEQEDAAKDAGWEAGYRALELRDAFTSGADVFGAASMTSSTSDSNPVYRYTDDVDNYVSAVNLGETNDLAGTVRGMEPFPLSAQTPKDYADAAEEAREFARTLRQSAESEASQTRVLIIGELLDAMQNSEKVLLESAPDIAENRLATASGTEAAAAEKIRALGNELASAKDPDLTAARVLEFIDLVSNL